MQAILIIFLLACFWFSCGLHGKKWAVWITVGIVLLTMPIGGGAILLGTLPGSPIIYLLVLGALNLLARIGVITLPPSRDPRDNLKGKSFGEILLMLFFRRRRPWWR